MKGFVATPLEVTHRMVRDLFEANPPIEGDRILYPGVGEGPFIKAVEDFCTEQGLEVPRGVACDTHKGRLTAAQKTFSHLPIDFKQIDFLDTNQMLGEFEYIIGNPPYVPITELTDSEKGRYRNNYQTATGRFDLYLLFFERALSLLSEEGRLVFITPEKFEYTETASSLRRLLTKYNLIRLEHVEETIFKGYTTYPTITIVENSSGEVTTVIPREGNAKEVELPSNGDRWSKYLRETGSLVEKTGTTLSNITERISIGVATGADSIFVFEKSDLPPQLVDWTYPTISGRELEEQTLTGQIKTNSVFVCPYDERGNLIKRSDMGEFGDWLDDVYRSQLESRSCYENGDQIWYGWHETPPMNDILQEKILFRDITDNPRFWIDQSGEIVPRHSVYYLIPKEGVNIEFLQTYLNTEDVSEWLKAHCQRARNGYLRLQTSVIEDLPVPTEFGPYEQSTFSNPQQ